MCAIEKDRCMCTLEGGRSRGHCEMTKHRGIVGEMGTMEIYSVFVCVKEHKKSHFRDLCDLCTLCKRTVGL